MAKKQNRKLKPVLLVLAAAMVLVFGWLLFSNNIQLSGTRSHVSEDLKISFEYPKRWFVQDKNFDILLSSYKTHIGQNSRPSSNQVKIFIDYFNNGCSPGIEENLKDPACGEGGPDVKPNEIISKEVSEVPGGKFYKYMVKAPDGKQLTYYLLENGDRILQISKEPDPSQFEEEFEAIVRSITFQ